MQHSHDTPEREAIQAVEALEGAVKLLHQSIGPHNCSQDFLDAEILPRALEVTRNLLVEIVDSSRLPASSLI